MAEDNFREVYAWARTPDEAKASAKTAAKRIERSKRQIELTLPGRIELVAGMVVNLVGFRGGVSGRWKLVSVRHTISRSGFLTAITGESAQ